MVNTVTVEFNLNEGQKIAFGLCAKAFITDYYIENSNVLRTSTHVEVPTRKSLRMLMMGPGRTGKTHVVNALRCLMGKYGWQHRIRYLVPTGTAASLIDGMTIHKGLGIKIKPSARLDGELNAKVTVTIQNCKALRKEWKDVNFVLVDEVSMLGEELLCEIDHALRYAKENRDDWFGGVNIIFSGDFFQYPPVGSSPLYTPLSSKPKQTTQALYKCLGQLAWKSIDTVVELTEQQRMKDDPEYRGAVSRQRI